MIPIEVALVPITLPVAVILEDVVALPDTYPTVTGKVLGPEIEPFT